MPSISQRRRSFLVAIRISVLRTTLSDGSLVYLPCDASWTLIGEKPCLAYPAQSGTASGSPSLTFLRYASGPVARLGQRDIDGVETTGIPGECAGQCVGSECHPFRALTRSKTRAPQSRISMSRSGPTSKACHDNWISPSSSTKPRYPRCCGPQRRNSSATARAPLKVSRFPAGTP